MGEHRLIERLVDLDEADRILARRLAAEMEGRDVDPGLAEGAPKAADEARLVEIAHEQHGGAELGLHRNRLDLDNPWLVAAEERARHAALLVAGGDGQADQRV